MTFNSWLNSLSQPCNTVTHLVRLALGTRCMLESAVMFLSLFLYFSVGVGWSRERLLHPVMSLVVSPWFAGWRQFCAVLFTLWLKELVAIKGWVSKYQNLKQLHFLIFIFKDFSISVYLIGSGTKIKFSDINTLEPATENQRLSFIVLWKSYFQDEISMENLVETVLTYIVLRLKLFCTMSD